MFVLKGAEWEAYGNFSFALQPYLDQKITDYLYSRPGVQDIANVVDPLVYIKRYTFPVAMDKETGGAFASYSVDACPTNYLIDAKGKIVYRATGFNEKALRAALASLGIR